jgi:hypothetical protein
MPLKNKDGTVYKLKGPNPLMESQKLWTDYTAHNLKFTKEIVASEIPKTKIIEKKDDFISELEATKPVVTPPPSPIIPEKAIETTYIHCFPAIVKESVHPIYGETYKTIQYIEPFSFEGVIINQQDLFIEVWTTAEITENSVLYPKNESKRWWKVQKKMEKAQGWLLTGIPSDIKPVFDKS